MPDLGQVLDSIADRRLAAGHKQEFGVFDPRAKRPVDAFILTAPLLMIYDIKNLLRNRWRIA